MQLIDNGGDCDGPAFHFKSAKIRFLTYFNLAPKVSEQNPNDNLEIDLRWQSSGIRARRDKQLLGGEAIAFTNEWVISRSKELELIEQRMLFQMQTSRSDEL